VLDGSTIVYSRSWVGKIAPVWAALVAFVTNGRWTSAGRHSSWLARNEHRHVNLPTALKTNASGLPAKTAGQQETSVDRVRVMLVRERRSVPLAAFAWSTAPIQLHAAPTFCEQGPVESGQGFGRLVVNSVVTLTTLAISALMLVCAAHAEVRVHGATTVAFGLMNPQKAKIEQLAGVELSILPSSTTHGLADLAQGRADVAMLAEPLKSAAAAVNEKTPGLVDRSQYADSHVGDALVQFIVHPSNPVRTLTKAQLAALYSGRIKNWSELGGSNQSVLLVGEPTSSPYRLIRDALGISYAPDMRAVQNTNQTAIIVAQAPGAISNISTAHNVPERSRLKVVDTDVRIPLALYLAYRKDAPAEVERVVDAARSVGRP
jgi:phosphate transport system substrate-binding protein